MIWSVWLMKIIAALLLLAIGLDLQALPRASWHGAGKIEETILRLLS